MNRLGLLPLFIVIIASVLLMNFALGEDEKVLTCPEECEERRDNCEFSCSQLVGGGAKSAERRECKRECGRELEGCKVRCINPTPRPTLKPEAYYDRVCTNACDLKLVDCNEVCTKYTGGGAKSGKKTTCRRECAESAEYCNRRCADPSLPKRPDRIEKPELSCREDCDYKLQDCESGCSIYIGGGAKSGKRAKCVSQCKVRHEDCAGSCTD